MIQVKDKIYYLGFRDWELRTFHGHELSTFNGSSYNSYLIKDEKTVLVDTVWSPHAEDFMRILDNEVDISKIDYIVVNHAEPDHSGTLPRILERNPDITVICSVKGKDILRKTYHKDWNFRTVKTGDTISIGQYELMFVEMTMIHWPESMMTFVKGPNVLLSNDAFGQHYSGESLFADECDECKVWAEAFKYFAAILAPFTKLIRKKIDEVIKLNLPIEMIAPSHGVIWRKEPLRIIEKYALWADDYNDGSVTIVYDTMYNATKKMADAIAAGLVSKGVICRLYNTSVADMSDVITELFRSRGIIVGSCTVNNGTLRSITAILDEIRARKFKNKIGGAFGSFGWSGESPKIIFEELEKAGLKMIGEPISVQYQPEPQELEACVQYGKDFADHLK